MRVPVTRIYGKGKKTDLVPGWGAGLISATLTDNDGGEADELVLVFAVQPPFPSAPAISTPFFPSFGWSEDGADMEVRDGGMFEVQNVAYGGDAESGYTMTVTSRSADFADKMKEMDSEHFEETTAGDVFQKIASKAGYSATVDPEIASAKIPYRLRWSQSPAGFANDLASDFGGTMKMANGQMLVAKRNSGKTASGTMMPPIVVSFSEVIEFDVSIEVRPEYSETSASWFDPLEGISKLVSGSSVGSGGRLAPLHPYNSEDEAKAGGESEGGEQARSAVSGSITIPGRPGAMAGAPVILIGFGGDLDGAMIVAPTITHERTFDDSGGYLTTLDLESMKTE